MFQSNTCIPLENRKPPVKKHFCMLSHFHLHHPLTLRPLRCILAMYLQTRAWCCVAMGWGVKRIFLHLGSWQSLAFLGVPWRTLADLPKSLATMPHGNASHKPWEWPCSQFCFNAGKDLWASGLKFQKWWNTYGTLEKIWKEFHTDKSRGAEKMRICIGRCANGAASLRAAVPCLNMET